MKAKESNINTMVAKEQGRQKDFKEENAKRWAKCVEP